MSNSSAKPVNLPIINVQRPTEPAVPLVKALISSSQSSTQWASGTLAPTLSVASPVLPPEESIIQPGVSIPIYDLPSPLKGTLSKTKRVGGGGYSDVYRGEWTTPNEEPVFVAIKCIRRVHLGDDTEEQESQDRFEKRIKREAVVWQTAKHDNILEFCGFQIIDGDPVFVSPWCENGNLREYIKRHPELADVEKLELLRDAAQGLAHLHSLEPPIIHGDIKPDNVMVTNDIRGVLCDFGISRVMTTLGIHTGLTTAGQAAGTAGFLAKELYEEYAQPTPMSDVYAFGGLILATMSGKPPFHKKLPHAALTIILSIQENQTASPDDHPELPDSDPLWSLLNRCWHAQPGQRPSVGEIIAELVGESHAQLLFIGVTSPTVFLERELLDPFAKTAPSFYKVRSALVTEARSMCLSKTEHLEFEFNGTEGIQYQDFLQHIRRIAFSEGESRNFAWMADLAALHFSGEALKWYESLDDDTQQDWNLLRKAVAKKYGSESDEGRADEVSQDTEPNEARDPHPEDVLLPARIEITNWTAPILVSSLRFPRSQGEWVDEARNRKAKFSGNAKAVYWHLVETKEPIPKNAIPTGNENGRRIFSIRVWKDGGLTLGKQVRGGLFWTSNRAWIPWWGKEIQWDGPFEILVGDPAAVRWVSPREAGRFHAVEGGFEVSRDQALFIAQFNQMGQLEPGKVFSADGQRHFGWWLFELHDHNFRVLAWA